MKAEPQGAMRLLADTSAWIARFQSTGHERLKQRLKEALEQDVLVMSGMVLCELLQGARSQAEYRNLHRRLQALHYLITPEETWQKAARLSFELRKKGIVVPTTDLLIAQTALDHGCSLLHCDKHFDWIARHSDLAVIPA